MLAFSILILINRERKAFPLPSETKIENNFLMLYVQMSKLTEILALNSN